ncbi:MAG TPA: XRE family transcriptional regulator [Mycobacteriales bacterium]|nr:XRE family transcriptional regulator [Mycobacteriales bacterium]
MAASIPALVEPAVLRWARETVGLTQVAAARKLGLPDDRVTQWESGEARPSVAQLRKASAVYRRSLAVFFLPEPPTDFDTLRDFRRHVGAAAGEWSPELHGEYRRAHTQRDCVLELADIDDDTLPTAWRLTGLPDDDDALAARARAALLEQSPLALPRGAGTAYEHLNAWTAALEEAGVLVLATQRGGVSPDEMRAFSLYFDVLPVIVVNGADSARGRLFSMVHEYAHLLLHTEGLCDTVSDARATSPNRQLEARCNGIAAAMLMPKDAVLAQPEVQARRNQPTSWDYDALRAAAAPFGVSAEAFLRRLVTLDRVTLEFYLSRRDDFLAAYAEDEERTRASGGNWYRNTARDLGKGYVRRVTDAYSRRVIDSYTAASYLDVKVGQIQRLAQEAALQVPA